MEKLLVSVLGNRNSGKSYTWNALFCQTVKTGKNERRLYLNNNEYVNVFLVSGSPEERGLYVDEIITAQDPKIVLCSTQYRESVKDTFNYFIENGYFLYVHWLNPGCYDNGTPYPDHLNLVDWLLSQQSLIGKRANNRDDDKAVTARVDEMKEYIYGWAKARGLCKIRSA